MFKFKLFLQKLPKHWKSISGGPFSRTTGSGGSVNNLIVINVVRKVGKRRDFIIFYRYSVRNLKTEKYLSNVTLTVCDMYLILSNFCPLKIFSIYCVLPLEPIIFLFIFIAYCEKHFGSYLDKHLLHHHILYKIILLLHVSLRRGNNVSLISEAFCYRLADT